MNPPHNEHDLTLYRLDQVENAVATMATAAKAQTDFNSRVEAFMEAVKTWGRIGMILYGTTQAIGLILLAFLMSHLKVG